MFSQFPVRQLAKDVRTEKTRQRFSLAAEILVDDVCVFAESYVRRHCTLELIVDGSLDASHGCHGCLDCGLVVLAQACETGRLETSKT